MKSWVKVFIVAVIALAAIPLLIFAYLEMREERDREAKMEAPVRLPPRVARASDGGIVVKLDEAAQARAGIRLERLREATLAQETAAYGRFEEDPSTVFSLRAPVAGTLRAQEGRPWPTLGDVLDEGISLGLIDPRFAPADRVDFTSRLAAAKADLETSNAALVAAQSAFERVRVLNSEEKLASDRALEDAKVRVSEQEARLRAAQYTVRVLEASLAGTAGEAASLPLLIPRAGEIVGVFAQPGEVVESGREILRLARFDRLLARAVLPAGERVVGIPASARILALGYEDKPIQATGGTRVGTSALAVPGELILFRIEPAGLPLRPGMAFQAWIPQPGESQSGVILPRAAIIRFAGRSWAYVQVAEGEFSRREIWDPRSLKTGWFVSEGFAAGQTVVTIGAQVLLSEELKSQIQVGEEEQRKG